MIEDKNKHRIQRILKSPLTIEDVDDLYQLYRPIIKEVLRSESSFLDEYVFSFECRSTQDNLFENEPIKERGENSENELTRLKRIVPANLLEPLIYSELKKTLITYLRECNKFNIRPSMRIFCEYFCGRRDIYIKYASMRNNERFRTLWSEGVNEWQNKLKKQTDRIVF